GFGTLAEYVFAVNLHIDQLVVHSRAGPHPGRPSPLTALALTLLAAAVLIFDSRPAARARPSEWLVLLAGFIALAGLTGEILGLGTVYRLGHVSGIGVAVPSALSLLVLSLGFLLSTPDAGFMAAATPPPPARGLVPAP